MTSAYKHAMSMIHDKAEPSMVKAFKTRINDIREGFQQCSSSVQSCLDGLPEEPTMLELHVAAFVVNGGFLFKYVCDNTSDDESVDCQDELSSLTFDDLIKEANELSLSPKKKTQVMVGVGREDVKSSQDIVIESQDNAKMKHISLNVNQQKKPMSILGIQ